VRKASHKKWCVKCEVFYTQWKSYTNTPTKHCLNCDYTLFDSKPPTDSVNEDPVSPPHYQSKKIDAIEITETMSFCAGNAMKYIWRHLDKGKPVEDLKKAVWYLEREIERIGDGE